MKEISIKSLKSNYNIIDIRDSEFYNMGHALNAINIPMDTLLSNMNLLGCELLETFGYNVINVFDGYDNY